MTDDDNSTIKLSYQAIGGKEIEFTKLVAVFVFCFSLSLSLSLSLSVVWNFLKPHPG
jgi:hypothetical protein